MDPVDLESAPFFADPGPTLARLREEEPVHFHAPLGAWILTRYDDVSRVLRDPTFSVDRGGAIARCPVAAARSALDECNEAFGAWMVFSDRPRHTRLRDRIAPAFTPARVRGLRPHVVAVARSILAAWRAAPAPRDLIATFASPLPARVTASLLGIPEADLARLETCTDDAFAFFGATVASAETVRRAHASLGAMRAYFEEELAKRRVAPSGDLLSWLVAAEAREPMLHEGELVGLAMTLVAGAFGTTTHLIGHAVHALLTRPDAWARVVRDPSLAAAVVEETLRYDGPALSVQRRATTDVELRGRTIRAGERLYCMLHAANHDPTVFDAPERFDLDRRSSRHLGLGAGTHFCLGASLTRLEAEVAIETLARLVPDLALDDDARRSGTMAMRGLETLPVRLGGADDRCSPR